MDARSIASEVKLWLERYQFQLNGGKVRMVRVSGAYQVDFTTRTTMTRASSMVTRIQLIVDDVLRDAGDGGLALYPDVEVNKNLLSAPPQARDDLADWHIWVNIPVKKKRTEKTMTA